MIKAKCPGSCGELLQGLILGGEKLISYPINRYSVVTLMEKENRTFNYPKAYEMLERVFSYYGYGKKESYNLSLNISSKIPKAKGMASSTSDLAATALVSAKYLGRKISDYEIAKLCTDIEPTDSIVFSNITLFDHVNGNFIKKLGKLPDCKVLLLEGKNQINTLDFHKINRYKKLKKHESKLNEALMHIKKGIKNKDLNEIGKASIISALSN
ncbi:MAG: propanediol utilization protein [Firmicutes bacterium]|nr:propanediol utilization protein [Bacillota bacterium]